MKINAVKPKMPIRTLLSVFLLAITIGFTACGNENTGEGTATTDTDGTNATAEVLIQPVGNEMKFDKTSFTVEAGQEVTIVFENTATSPAMQHNVLVLNADDDETVNRVGQAAIAAGEANEYVPEDDAILAHTALAQPGETVRVTFTAPSQPGTYRYICTFPGHYMMMQGIMTVT
jgi:azurin